MYKYFVTISVYKPFEYNGVSPEFVDVKVSVHTISEAEIIFKQYVNDAMNDAHNAISYNVSIWDCSENEIVREFEWDVSI